MACFIICITFSSKYSCLVSVEVKYTRYCPLFLRFSTSCGIFLYIRYIIRHSLKSFFIPSKIFSILHPRCSTNDTHGRLYARNFNFFKDLFFFKNAIHFVLLLLTFSFVLKVRLCSFAYLSHVLIISCKPSNEGDKRA